MIYDHNDTDYKRKWLRAGDNKYNGAYYYSREIVANIIPNVTTSRNWVTINNPPSACADHSIVFVHNNVYPELYDWLASYKDLVLVCGVPQTCAKVDHLGTAIYLPLSIDVAYVEQFRTEHDKDTCYVGRRTKRMYYDLGRNIDTLENLPRHELLRRLAHYQRAYAVGRCALEAKALGVEILPYDERYPDTDLWKVLDNREAAKLLQDQLDRIDGYAN